jgi:hypothetical protein
MVVHAYNPSTREAQVEDKEFKVNIGYIEKKMEINK